MELILGLPPLTQYDAAATPMFNCFQHEAVVTPYNGAHAPGGPAREEHPALGLLARILADELQGVRPRARG